MDCFFAKMRSGLDAHGTAFHKSATFAFLLTYGSANTLIISQSITQSKIDLLYYSMNQDSDKNENRRDGDAKRSFGRRDDGRNSNADRPRFNRAEPRDDQPRSARPGPRSGSDRPSFNRDDKPRFGRNDGGSAPAGRGDRPDRPRSNDRNRDERPARTGGSPFESRNRNDSDRSRPDRPSGPSRPSFGRDRNDSDRNRPTDSRPRFERNDRPRSADSDQRRPRFDRDRSDDKPRFERRDDKPRFERTEERPRVNRDDRTNAPDQRPRFNQNTGAGDRTNGPARPRFERRDDDRDRKRSSDTPRPRPFDRDEKSDRFSRDSNDRNRPGSGGNRARTDKSGPSRVGGFSREADERNRENWSEGRTPDSDKHANRNDSGSRNTRFTPEQRKDSGERRTGFFVKAPNYELEQTRLPGAFKRNDRPDGPKPRPDRYAEKKQADARAKDSQRDEKLTRTPAADPNTTRLNRYIANSGVCSRREADELIARGDISVNGKIVTEMGFRVKEGDMVKYGTKALTPERFVYVLLNKPKDYITTTEDPEERKTVMELVADAGNFRMYPVGRLDRKTTGLLLLTNDGELADKLTHPSNEVRKVYQVELDKPITEEHFSALKNGIELEDGPIKPDALSIVTPDAYVVGIEIHSGRNHIVRRMFESLGYEVTKLDRTAYAGLTKKELPRGKWRFLDPKEVVKLKYLS